MPDETQLDNSGKSSSVSRPWLKGDNLDSRDKIDRIWLAIWSNGLPMDPAKPRLVIRDLPF
jgi:hypothetical protein